MLKVAVYKPYLNSKFQQRKIETKILNLKISPHALQILSWISLLF